MCVCVCVSVFLCVCVSVRLSVPCSCKRFLGNYLGHHHQTWHGDYLRHEMNHVFIILTLTFIQLQGRTNLNHENNKCSIISETVRGMPINFAVKVVRQKVYIILYQSDGLALHSRSPLCLKRDNYLNCTIIAISRTI